MRKLSTSFDKLNDPRFLLAQQLMNTSGGGISNVGEGIRSAANNLSGAYIAKQAGQENLQKQNEYGTELQRLFSSGQNQDSLLKAMLANPNSDVRNTGIELYAKSLSGEDKTPAPLQLANEYAKARKSGDTQRMQDITMFAKSLDKNVTINAAGSVAPREGVIQSLSDIEHGKQTGKNISDLGYKPLIAGKEANAKEVGKQGGEAYANLVAAQASMPQLEDAVNTLSDLGKKATYTMVGQGVNAVRRQTGLPANEGAKARSEYVAHVKNNVLPLLRRTFGAQFTKAEGDSLLATLGDPNSSPQEKDATLRAFIEDKRASLGTMQREVQGFGTNIPSQSIQQPQAGGAASQPPGKLLGTSGGKRIFELPDGSHVMEQ